eukprot:s5189_g3.t1
MAEQRVRELERLLIYKEKTPEAELARERDKCERAKKKVRQLLAKLSERDGKIAELTLKLEAKASKSGKDPGRVAKQRAQIVAQLEEHLVQMQQDLQAQRDTTWEERCKESKTLGSLVPLRGFFFSSKVGFQEGHLRCQDGDQSHGVGYGRFCRQLGICDAKSKCKEHTEHTILEDLSCLSHH